MSRSTDSQSNPRREDPRLQEFLRRASPIIAAERGWNERSQLKIKSLASDLKLPETLYQIAVQKLQEGDLLFDKQPGSYERAFVKFVQEKILSTSTSVLTAAHETKAVRIARRRFEIEPERARELVRQVAEKLGISRVSKLDAVEYVASIVDEQIGNATVVPDAVRGRIHHASGKWGVDSNQVEILIQNRLEANRQHRPAESPWKIRVTAAVLSMAFMFGLVWIIRTVIPDPVDTEPDKEEVEATTDPQASAGLDSPSVPIWWSPATTDLFRKFTSNPLAATFPHELLKSEEMENRLTGYQKIMELTQNASTELESSCTSLLASLFADESNEAGREMAQAVVGFGTFSASEVPSNLAAFSNVWQASRIIEHCLQQPLDQEKIEILDQCANQLTGVSILTPDFEKVVANRIAQQQWQLLNKHAFRNPQQVARLVDAMGDLMRQHSVESVAGERETVVSLLMVKPVVWSSMKRTLQRCVDAANEDQLRSLFLIVTESGLADLDSWIGRRIAQRLNLPTERMTASKIRESIDTRLSLDAGSTSGNQSRWQRLREHRDVVAVLENREANPDLALVGQAIHFGTVAFLLNRANTTGNRNWQEQSDVLFDEGPRNLSVRTTREVGALPVYRRIQRRAFPSDFQTLESSMDLLGNPEPHSSQARARAFEQLARSAPRIRDIDYDDGQKLARYMLEASETAELVAIEKFASQLRHWPNLVLGFAEQMEQSDGSADQALTCASLLLELNPALESGNWRQQLKHQVLIRIADGLRNTAEIQGHDNRYHWNELRAMLIQHYRIRCAAAGVPGAKFSAANSPAKLVALLAMKLQESRGAEGLQHELESNRYLANNELEVYAFHLNSLARAFDRTSATQPGNHLEQAGLAINRLLLDGESAFLREYLKGKSW